MKVFIVLHDFSMVLEFSIAGFRQQQTQTSSNNRDGAIYKHGDGVMINIQEPDHWSEDPRHTSTHGVQTHTILPVNVYNGQVIIV